VGHAAEQRPQLRGSLVRSAHDPAPQHWPAAPVDVRQNGPCVVQVSTMHTPPTHMLPTGHPPAPPQSVVALPSGRHVTTGPPPAYVTSAHTPDAHARPHPPQFPSRHESTHAPPQQMPTCTPAAPHEVPSATPAHVSRPQ
jgi:hypothetical protein